MAAGDTLFSIHPWAEQGAAATQATKDTVNLHQVLVFNAAGSEEANFKSLMPVVTPTTTVIVLTMAAATATTGNVAMNVAIEREQDIDTDGFATTVQAGAVSVPGNSGTPFKVSVNMTQAQMDGVLKAETFRIRLSRRTDSAAGAAYLLWVHGEEG